ncbi:uncharacterized protein [Nicotiana sylvestris]|uniref:uncharacterized protein n=1 Tax=Nicotiana sylvestris TaxID=4096 RepID=UPI00388CB248
MAKAHTSRYFVHPVSTTMYHDLKEVYWWNDMKRNIVDFAAKCPNYQQVKADHQRSGRLAQNIEIPMWKWEMINMDFVVGLPCTPCKFDSIWVIVDRLKKCTLLPVKSTDTAEQDLEFKEDDWVFLKVSPMKGIMQFGNKGKLSSRYIGPYKIIQRIGQVAYKLDLPPEMSLVHPVFHVSMLKKVVGDMSLIVPVETIEANEELSYEEILVSILDSNMDDKQEVVHDCCQRSWLLPASMAITGISGYLETTEGTSRRKGSFGQKQRCLGEEVGRLEFLGGLGSALG